MRCSYWPALCVYVLSHLLVFATAYNRYENNEVLKAGSHAPAKQKDKWSTSMHLLHYLLKREKPWLLLPNNNNCYQNGCDTDRGCCRKYNICDRSAKVCIDCWYGYPCRTTADCCERYPVCSKKYSGQTRGRCVRK